MALSRKNPWLASNVISQIHQLSTEFLKAGLDRAGATGLVSSHGHILACLFMEDHLPMNRIADMIGRRKSTLTVLADKLEQEGYIQREVSPEDSRVRMVSLTDKGRSIRQEFENISARHHECLWRGFSPEEQAQAMDYLCRMEANFLTARSRTGGDAGENGHD